MKNIIETLDAKTKSVLEQNGFETIPFETLLDRLAREGIDPKRNWVKGPVTPLGDDQVDRLPEEPSEIERLEALGRAAIDAGEVAALILNGGMATRFGGRPKGVAEAVDDRSFLDLKLKQLDVEGGGKTPVLLMNSFATDETTREHLKTLSVQSPVRPFNQMVSVRVTRDGELFKTDAGTPSLHAPGHGDLLYALPRSGELDRFVEGGGKYITVTNVDNLAAGLDPLVIGLHIDRKRPMTVEIVPIYAGDAGGFPAVLDDRPVLLEAFRVPDTFDFMDAKRFNTNSFVFDAEAFRTRADLSFYTVLKKVDGREAVQFERLIGQLTEFVEVTWLEVPREGPGSRFVPVKTPQDLVEQADTLRTILKKQGVM